MSELGGTGDGASSGWSAPGGDGSPPPDTTSNPAWASPPPVGAPPPFPPPSFAQPSFPQPSFPQPSAPPQQPGGAARSSSNSKVIIITVLFVVAALVALAVLAAMAWSSMSSMEPSESFIERNGQPLPGRTVDPAAPPEIIAPPPDGNMASMSIAELITFVFTPNPDPAAWEARFSDPTGLRAQIEPFVGTLCAVGVQTKIVSIEYLGPDRARVEFVFLGPNIPEIGTTFAFFGHVRREPGGPWVAEPDIVEHVAGLASGFCLQQEVTPREGIEDDVDGKGTHDPGELVDPLHP